VLRFDAIQKEIKGVREDLIRRDNRKESVRTVDHHREMMTPVINAMMGVEVSVRGYKGPGIDTSSRRVLHSGVPRAHERRESASLRGWDSRHTGIDTLCWRHDNDGGIHRKMVSDGRCPGRSLCSRVTFNIG